MNDMSEKSYETLDNPRNVMGVKCNSTTDSKWEDCTFSETECSPVNAVKVECACKCF